MQQHCTDWVAELTLGSNKKFSQNVGVALTQLTWRKCREEDVHKHASAVWDNQAFEGKVLQTKESPNTLQKGHHGNCKINFLLTGGHGIKQWSKWAGARFVDGVDTKIQQYVIVA